MVSSDKIVFLTVIVDRKHKDMILTELVDMGVFLLNTIYGQGTVNASYLTNMLGLVPEKKKAVITCVSKGRKAEAFLQMLADKFDFDKPGAGIAFTIPVDKVSF
jgi:hypothetical protein